MGYKIKDLFEDNLRRFDKETLIERILQLRKLLSIEEDKAYEHYKHPYDETDLQINMMDAQGYLLGIEWARMKLDDMACHFYEISEGTIDFE